MAIFGGIYTIWLIISTERQRFKGLASKESSYNTSGSGWSTKPESVHSMASRQEERKRQVLAYCKKTRARALQAKDLNHFIVDSKHRLVYCYIPKVACSKWKKIMAKLVGLTGKSVHKQKFNFLSYHSKADIRYILQNYYKFLFVREPFERLLSAYRNKLTNQTDIYKLYASKIKQSVRVRLGANETSSALHGEFKFEDFISYLIDTHSIRGKIDEHWNHYDNLCHPCEIDFDFIGKYETLSEDAPFVLREAGVDHLVSFPPIRYTSTRNSLGDYYSKVPREDIMRVKKLYRRDLEMFGYNAKNSLGSIIK